MSATAERPSTTTETRGFAPLERRPRTPRTVEHSSDDEPLLQPSPPSDPALHPLLEPDELDEDPDDDELPSHPSFALDERLEPSQPSSPAYASSADPLQSSASDAPGSEPSHESSRGGGSVAGPPGAHAHETPTFVDRTG